MAASEEGSFWVKLLLATASVNIRQVSKRWIKSFFVSSTTTEKINMLTICNVKTEYEKMVIYKKQD